MRLLCMRLIRWELTLGRRWRFWRGHRRLAVCRSRSFVRPLTAWTTALGN